MSGPAPWDEPWPEAELERVPRCPVCLGERRTLLHENLADYAFASAPGRWTMWRCDGCGSGYLDPRPAAAHIGRAYAAYYTHDGDDEPLPPRTGFVGRIRRGLVDGYLNARFGAALAGGWRLGEAFFGLFAQRRLVLDHRVRHLPRLRAPGAALLDVGCGGGEFLALARDLGWTVAGLEPDPRAAPRALSRGLPVGQGGLELYAGRSGLFDAITLSHVIEHVPDPRGDLAACLRLLRPGGMLFCATPNIGAAGHRAWGAAWRGLEPPRHLQLFAHRALHRLLGELGYAGVADLPQPDPRALLDAESARLAAGAGRSAPRRNPGRVARPDSAIREFLCVAAYRPDRSEAVPIRANTH